MRLLVIHQNFPGQFRHLMAAWSRQPGWQVIGLGRDSAPGMPDVKWFKYRLHRSAHKQQHHYLRQMENAVLHGQAVARALMKLKAKGFTPHVILAHPGWGETLYAKDVFPDAKLIHFCEWFYGVDADFDFDPEFPPSFDDRARIRSWNALHLLNLENCDAGVTPTRWQWSRHPEAYRDKIRVVHEGIDVDGLAPPWANSAHGADPGGPDVGRASARQSPSIEREEMDLAIGRLKPALPALRLPSGHTFHAGDPVITYVARNLEPYRGFHSFMRALEIVQKQHKHCHALIVGGDDVSYGQRPKDAKHWREKMLREVKLDPERTHFLGRVPYETYKQVLQVSAAHVYLTYPFVLSWSMLEAMASGCLVIGSRTPPVEEVIRDGENGVLVDFFDRKGLAETLVANVEQSNRSRAERVRAAADMRGGYSASQGTERLRAMILEGMGSRESPVDGAHGRGGSSKQNQIMPEPQVHFGTHPGRRVELVHRCAEMSER